MDWIVAIAVIFGSLMLLLASGLPTAFCFLFINLLGAYFLWGGTAGIVQLCISIQASLASFILLPIPLFIMMGEILFLSGVGVRLIETLDQWIGRVPGRLSLVAVASGTLLSTMTGASIASCAMLGSVLTPEMERKKYKKSMSLGPIMGSGCLAMMVPPSTLAVLLCAISYISVGKTLIAIILPGIIMAILYAGYIIIRCYMNPSLAPPYDAPSPPLWEKVKSTVRYILPTGLIIFGVLGTMFLGLAGPTEASALGVIATVIVVAFQIGLNKKFVDVLKKSVMSTVVNSVMVCMIICGAIAFSQILAFSGGARGLVVFAMGLSVPPIVIIIVMVTIGIILGFFLEPASIMMICLPPFLTVLKNFGFDLVWFATIFLMVIEMGMLTPPFGLVLYVMKGVAPPDTTTGDCIRAAVPYIIMDAMVIGLVIAFPKIALFLPGLMLPTR